MKVKGFWVETGRKIARDQKRHAQRGAVAHPLTFGVVWAVKALLWDAPRALVRMTQRGRGR